ncbi:sensor histidine kinase [Glycocaulis profundi]|nr:sensor histidine kinase [Glycocaulis profundi]
MTFRATETEPLLDHWRESGGETGAQIAAGTLEARLGPVEDWPPELIALISFALSAHEPIAIWWGSDRLALFNDAWARLGGGGWIARLGAAGETALPRDWSGMADQIDRVFSGAPGLWLEDQHLAHDPEDPADEDYFTVSLNPARDHHGAIAGVVAVCCETTSAVRNRRRLSALRELNEAMALVEDDGALCRAAAGALKSAGKDLPQFAIHLFDLQAGEARLAAGDAALAVSEPGLAFTDLQTEAPSGACRVLRLERDGARFGALSARVPPALMDDDGHADWLAGVRDALAAALALRHQMRARQSALAAFRHRIQSNLQAVNALVSAAAEGEGLDADMLQDRISQMGAGQIALSSLEPGGVASGDFLPALVREIGATFPNAEVRLRPPVMTMSLDDTRAGAIAFIVGENARAVQNGNPGGAIEVALAAEGENRARLSVAHDRMVPPRDQLPLADMIALFARQLDGEMAVREDEGAPVFSVLFPRP